MRSSLIRRTAVVASAVSLALLVTACGGDKAADAGKNDKAGKDGGAAAAPAPAAKVLTAAELEKAVLAEGDVKGHKVSSAKAEEIGKPGDVTVDKQECLPLAEAASSIVVGTSTAHVTRKVVEEPKPSAGKSAGDMTEGELEDAFASSLALTMTVDTLASYEGKGAEETAAKLRAAGTACAGGFTVTQAGDKTKVLKVEEAELAGGDEAAAWVLTSEVEAGKTMPIKVAAVRQGATLTTFMAVNIGAALAGKDYPLPTAVIDAQVAKTAKLS
ncbi:MULTISPECIES: hypothetical protein [Streptomyces]|uniref:Lipoprotein n=1 Tax=Streptomyces sudanensis TaxID=436397 RepID=A0ABY4T910_9ACTN|nr:MULTISPECIES: hypothetical protein [Streptomyces]URN15396.1 hypothetical protein MW084_04930 [Streptomyces sudanensis]